MPSKRKPSDDQLNNVLDTVRKQYGRRPEVTGCDIGFRWNGDEQTKEICVRIHVERKIPLTELESASVLPQEIDGVPIDIIEGPYRRHRITRPDEHARRHSRVMGGISCGRTTGETGTAGAIVIDDLTGQPAILSNWHVLHGPHGVPGDNIIQPGIHDGGRPDQDLVAHLSRAILDQDGDAAIAELAPETGWLPLMFGSYVQPARIREVELGETLIKSGRTTAQTAGQVDGIGFYQVQYEITPGVNEVREIAGFKIVTFDPDNPEDLELSSGGDSGSAWTDPTGQEAVGLHFAGETSLDPRSEFAIACHMSRVSKRLKFRLATFDDLLELAGNATAHPSVPFGLQRDNLANLPELSVVPPYPGAPFPFPRPITGPFPPYDPWPVGPWPTPWGPRPGPYPLDWYARDFGRWADDAFRMRHISQHAFNAAAGLESLNRQSVPKIPLSVKNDIWPKLNKALKAHFKTDTDFDPNQKIVGLTTGGTPRTPYQEVAQAIRKSPDFQADGISLNSWQIKDLTTLGAVCWAVAYTYPLDTYSITD